MEVLNFTVKETNIEKVLLNVLHDIVYKDDIVSAKKISKSLNISYKTLSRMLSENSIKPGEPKFPLIKLPALADEVDVGPLLEVLCAFCGYSIIEMKDIKEKIDDPSINLMNILTKSSELMRETAKLSDETIKALEDGKLTKKEKEKLLKQIQQTQKALDKLKLYIEIIDM